jgi:hypothetical protein
MSHFAKSIGRRLLMKNGIVKLTALVTLLSSLATFAHAQTAPGTCHGACDASYYSELVNCQNKFKFKNDLPGLQACESYARSRFNSCVANCAISSADEMPDSIKMAALLEKSRVEAPHSRTTSNVTATL